jgi:Zn-dependent M16 (insulinase) family peptidase
LKITKEEIQHALQTHIEPFLETAPLVCFGSKQLLEKENKKLKNKLDIQSIN